MSTRLLKRHLSTFVLSFALISFRAVVASQADDTTITITAQNSGPTPFIAQLTLVASQTTVISRIGFSIAPRSGSVTQPLSATFSHDYLLERGYLIPATGEVFLPVYGLYADYDNTVTLTYTFTDGSSKQDSTSIATASFQDPCGLDAPTVLQARTADRSLSYDYMMIKGGCSDGPAVIDSDGALRWMAATGIHSSTGTFFENRFYVASGTVLYRLELDGSVTTLHDYTDIGVTNLHHNIDRGRQGLILEADTDSDFESVDLEVDAEGNVLHMWNLADIISSAMIAGGDDPNQFVYPAPTDWFHNNAVAYNRADNSLIVSSRENFLIALDYDTSAIRWILGDPTKKWHEFPSLVAFALTLPAGSLPPIGQHGVGVTFDQNMLMLDNGRNSLFQDPPGENRDYATPRKYALDLNAKVATEVWNYPLSESVYSPFCGSAYEDSPFNYLVDYAFVGGPLAENPYAQLLGINAANEIVFYYQYPTDACATAFNALPIHLERTNFPAVGPQLLNISTRGMVGTGENALIAGSIINGTDSKTMIIRALGPSLESSGLTGTLADPVLTIFDASGGVVVSNDNWQSDANAAQVTAAGLAPDNPTEAAVAVNLVPGSYTAVVTGKDEGTGLGLVEAYDLAPTAGPTVENISTRGWVGSGDDVLIGGFVVGDLESATVVLRALGPSLGDAGVGDPLSDPALAIYDANGSAIASNDNWQEDHSVSDIEARGLAPADDAEAATILHLPAGAYTAIVNGADGETGVALMEVYQLD